MCLQTSQPSSSSLPPLPVPSQQLYGVAVFNNSLYWDDRQDGSLHRAYFDSSLTAASTGVEEVVLLFYMAIDVREVRLVKKSDLAIQGRLGWGCGHRVMW